MTTKKCPFCAEEIKLEALKCRFCGEFLTKAPSEDLNSQTPQTRNFEVPHSPIYPNKQKKKGPIRSLFTGILALILVGLVIFLYLPKSYQKGVIRTGIGLAVPLPKLSNVVCDRKNIKRSLFLQKFKSSTIVSSVDILNKGKAGKVKATLRIQGKTFKRIVWVGSDAKKTITIRFRTTSPSAFRCKWEVVPFVE